MDTPNIPCEPLGQVQPQVQSPAELAVGVTVRIGSVQCFLSEVSRHIENEEHTDTVLENP